MQRRLEDYSIIIPRKNNSSSVFFKKFCPYCGSDEYVKDGKRKRKYIEPLQVFLCRKCGRKFNNCPLPNLHYPIWVLDKIITSFVEGVRIKAIVQDVVSSSKMKRLDLSITIPTVLNIIRRTSFSLLNIEEYYHHQKISKAWEIDDCFQPLPHREWAYITNVLAIDTRFWLASHVSITRDRSASMKALQQAVSRAAYHPVAVHCDGLQAHSSAIKKILPHTCIHQKSKKEDISIVNYIERLNRTMRRGRITKGKNFQRVELLQTATDLTRMQYNFLERHSSLGMTPAQAAGINLSIDDWKNMISISSQLKKKRY